MTTLRPFVTDLSANERFKLQYPRYLRRAALVAVALTALFVWLFPRYEPQPYQLRRKEIIIIDFEVEAPILERPQVRAIPTPPKPIEAAPNDEVPVDPLENWDFDFWNDSPVSGTAPLDETPFVVSSANPVLKSFAKADYPEMARRAHLEGTVTLYVRVGRNGLVDKVEVIQSVHPLLDRAAVQAARRCRFEPARQREIAVRAWLEIPYRFRLN